jgi:glycerol-3-phosphate acyltransferase PlsY
MNGLLALVLAYLIGSVPFGYLLVKLTTGKDVRSGGSGNIGATNVLRTTGRVAAVATLLLDIAKGYLAVWITAQMTASQGAGDVVDWTAMAALAVMAGHAFPIFLKFDGGKAVASFIGAFLYVAPLALLAVLIVFLIAVIATRHISAGSVLAAGMFPLAVFLILHPPGIVLFSATVAGAFIVYRHKANLVRLRNGTESVFRWRRS